MGLNQPFKEKSFIRTKDKPSNMLNTKIQKLQNNPEKPNIENMDVAWRRKWQPTPVFLPEKSHGQRSLEGYSPWGHKVGHDSATKHMDLASPRKCKKKKKKMGLAILNQKQKHILIENSYFFQLTETNKNLRQLNMLTIKYY